MQNHISKVRLIMITIGAARGRAARGDHKLIKFLNDNLTKMVNSYVSF